MVWTDLFINLGYTGVFLISIIGAASVFIPIPYTATYYILGTALNPLFIAIAGGLGSALGELTAMPQDILGRYLSTRNRRERCSI